MSDAFAAHPTEKVQKRSGWDCWWPTCDKTAADEPLVRTEPKGQPGQFMCEQHAHQKRIEASDA